MPNHRPRQRSKELRASRAGPARLAAAKRGPLVSSCFAGPRRTHHGPAETVRRAGGQGREAAATSMCKASELPPTPIPPEGPSDSEWPEVTHSPSSPQTSGPAQCQGEKRKGPGSW